MKMIVNIFEYGGLAWSRPWSFAWQVIEKQLEMNGVREVIAVLYLTDLSVPWVLCDKSINFFFEARNV